MKALNIPQFEKRFLDDKKDTRGKKFLLEENSVPIKGSDEAMHYVDCIIHPSNKLSYEPYYQREKSEKTQIVLHFTAVYLKGDIAALTGNRKMVSVPFVIARDGTIFKLWSSAYWAYHLDIGGGRSKKMSQKTIAIEVSNIGPLPLFGQELHTCYAEPKAGKKDAYCHLDEQEHYIKLETPYRGKQYYATFTDAQYDSMITLLRYLTAEYGIPPAFLPEDQRYEVLEPSIIDAFQGITTHVNYRPSGKWDIGPAFEWDRLIKGVTQLPT